MIAAVAGTFNVLHEGHIALIERAFAEGDEVFIGITSDEMASGSRDEVLPLYMRRKAIEEYLSSKGREALIFEINDIYGPPELMDRVDVLVVSRETEENGKKVSEWRVKRSKDPLRISVVDLVNNRDGYKLNATDILKGLYSRNGESDTIKIAVGSLNRVKVEAVREVMESIYGSVRIYPKDVKSGVPDQPFGEETHRGARNRAVSALEDCDLSVGIEAGVFEIYDGLFDVQHCVIIDRDGRITSGMGSGFEYPKEIAELVRKGSTVGDAVDRLYDKTSVGHSEGAIGLLSKGLMDRKTLTKQSVLAAMIPRM